MKKLISTLMVGIVASACAMTTMAAPSFDHRAGPAPHQMDKKPMPPKPRFEQHNGPNSHFNKNNDRRDMNKHFDNRDHHPKFKKDLKRDHGPDRKAPPMPPKHR